MLPVELVAISEPALMLPRVRLLFRVGSDVPTASFTLPDGPLSASTVPSSRLDGLLKLMLPLDALQLLAPLTVRTELGCSVMLPNVALTFIADAATGACKLTLPPAVTVTLPGVRMIGMSIVTSLSDCSTTLPVPLMLALL
ncbi:hypothetical protein GALL_376370 [mine drainage metagenome]|uniref:Uncharacterized protein n=1 Tax=mine drainage metagenome TaxID=410659 RepID=A0A1J5QB39_9ZZZZ